MIFAEVENAVLDVPTWHWVALIGYFLLLIVADVVVFHRKDHVPSVMGAAVQTIIWISAGILLGGFVWWHYGSTAGGEYFSGFIIEKSLSMDNVFVWSVVLSYFGIPRQFQHRVLFWGIFGAMVMRGLFIGVGGSLLVHFEFLFIPLGLVLLRSAWTIVRSDDEAFDPESSKIISTVRRLFPVTNQLHGHKLFASENGKRMATMLFVALISLELIDVVFAVDSVPAILAVARDPFIMFASNIAAILGLRALYFVFDAIKDKFWLLNEGLGLILAAVGVKMIISPEQILGIKWFGVHIPATMSMLFILVTLLASIVISLYMDDPRTKDEPATGVPAIETE